MPHPAIVRDNVAVITGGASGIGFAAATAFARAGMKVCIADVDETRLAEAATKLSSITVATNVMSSVVDVSEVESVLELERTVRGRFGGTDVLMNNAGIQPGSTLFGDPDNWQRIIGVNMWGIINGSRIFAPNMIARGRCGLIITGSKQGITTPTLPTTSSKAGVKAFTRGAPTRGAQHERLPGLGTFIDPGLRLHRPDAKDAARSRPAPGRRNRPWISC